MTSKSGVTVQPIEASEFDTLIERLKALIADGRTDYMLAHSIRYAIEDAERRWERAVDLSDALTSDQALDLYAKKYLSRDPPVVRASTYEKIEFLQEVDNHQIFDCRDERRPVFMRGAYRFVMGDNRSVYKLVERYLRRKKYTCFDPKDNERVMLELQKAIENKKYGTYLKRTTHFPRDPDLEVHWRDGHCSIWIGGKHHSYLDVGRERPVIDPPPKLPPVMDTAVGAHRTGHQRKAAIVFKALQELGIEV